MENNVQIQIIRKRINIPFIIISIATLLLVSSIFIWSIVDDFYNFHAVTPNTQEFEYDPKSTFWILFMISNSLATIIEFFLLICYFLDKESELYHLFESTMSMIDIYFLYILWTIWASIMTVSGVTLWIPLIMYFLIAITWVLYIVKTVQNSSKNKKIISSLLIVLSKYDFKNKEEYEELYDALNDVKKIVNIKKSKKSKKLISTDTDVKQFDSTKRNDNGKTSKLEI